MAKKIHKCWYCKELLDLEKDDIITFEMGKKTISIKEAHRPCRQKVLDRKEFYDWLLETLDVPSVDKYTVMSLDALQKNGYNWQVLKHAVTTKLTIIQANFSKGLAYMCGIIRNQCPISYKEVEKEKNREIIKERNKQIIENQGNQDIITIETSIRKNSSVPLSDIADL